MSSATGTTPLRVAVVGGGITGLAAAHRLGTLFRESGQMFELTLFEAGGSTGGVFGTLRRDGYLVETGADSFITSKPRAVELAEELGLADQLIPTDETHRGALVLHDGKPVPVPEGFMLLAPAKVWPVLKSPLLSPRGKLRLACEFFVPRSRQPDDDESLASFVRRRFGRETLDRIVQPLVGGIYTSDPERLSLRATLPRFLEMEREHRSLIRAARRRTSNGSAERSGSGARYGLFVTFRDGMSVLLDTLHERVADLGTIRSGTPVAAVERNEDDFALQLPDGQCESFDRVLVATPAWVAADLLQPVDAGLAGRLRQIEYASSAIVCSGHRLEDVEHPLDAFGLVVPHAERRRILAVSFASRKFPGRAPAGRVLLRTFVGGAMQPELLEHTDDELVAIVREELTDTLGVRGEPDFTHVARWNRAMPQYHVGHVDRVRAIEEAVQKIPGLAVAGNAYRGVGVPDCVHSARQAAERIASPRTTVPTH